MTAPTTGFRPASGWQGGAAAPQVPVAATRMPIGLLLVAASAYLVGVQVLVGALMTTDLDAVTIASLLASWMVTGAVVSVLFAVAWGHEPSIVATGLLAAVELVAFTALGSGDVSAPRGVLAALGLAIAAAVMGALASRRRSRALQTAAVVVAACAVGLFYLLSIAAPVIAVGGGGLSVMAVLGAAPVACLTIAPALAIGLGGRRGALAAGWLLIALACSLLLLPALTAIVGQPPVVATVVVLGIRVALVALAGVLVLRSATR